MKLILTGRLARAWRVAFWLLFWGTGMVGCSAGKPKENRREEKTGPVFSMAEVPTVIASPDARAEYLAVHYWDKFDFSDTTGAWCTEEMKQAFLQYLNILHHSSGDAAGRGIRSMLQRSAETDTAKLNWFTELYRIFLDDPNSPLRNESLYIPVLEFIVECNKLEAILKVRPANRLRMALKNRPGSIAADFSFRDRQGRIRTMHGFRAEYTFLCFYNPGCHSCAELKKQLASSVVLQTLQQKQEALKVLMICPEPDADVWNKDVFEAGSAQWVAGYDPKGLLMKDELYDLRAIPTIYLLDRDKKVLLKDAPFQQVEFYLQQREQQAIN